MIVRRHGDEMLADRSWLAAFYRLSVETIRKRWQPVACDRTTRAALYALDEEAACEMRARRRVA